MSFSDYLKQLKSLNTTQLEAEIISIRTVLADCDAVYIHCREECQPPDDELLNKSTDARIRLQLAERVLAKHSFAPYGVSPMGWLDEEDA